MMAQLEKHIAFDQTRFFNDYGMMGGGGNCLVFA